MIPHDPYEIMVTPDHKIRPLQMQTIYHLRVGEFLQLPAAPASTARRSRAGTPFRRNNPIATSRRTKSGVCGYAGPDEHQANIDQGGRCLNLELPFADLFSIDQSFPSDDGAV